MLSKINFEDIISYEGTFDKINTIVADNIIISNLSIIDKFINLEHLSIEKCTMNYDDLVNFDYSTFTKLRSLSLISNSTKKYNFNIDILENLLSKDILFNNIEFAKAMVYNVINTQLFKDFEHDIIFNQNYTKAKYTKSNISQFIDYDEFKKIYKHCENIIFEYEKNVFEQNYEIESKIPLNKNIFKLSLTTLNLSYYHLNEFFNLLPEDSDLINRLNNLNFESHTNIKSYTNMFSCYIFSKIKNNKIKVDLSNTVITLDNESICKLLLFKDKLRNNVLLYLNSDMYYRGLIDKNKPPHVKLDNEFYDLVMYWKNICYYIDFGNCIINFKPNITSLFISVNRYIFLLNRIRAPLHESGEKLLCIQNLPNELTNLEIIFSNEVLDDINHDNCASNYLIDDNLPHTLKQLSLKGISKKMINNIKKIPYDCELKFYLIDEDSFSDEEDD